MCKQILTFAYDTPTFHIRTIDAVLHCVSNNVWQWLICALTVMPAQVVLLHCFESVDKGVPYWWISVWSVGNHPSEWPITVEPFKAAIAVMPDHSIALMLWTSFTSYYFIIQGIARTQSPTNINYAPESPTFGVIAEVSPTGVQWPGLALGEPP